MTEKEPHPASPSGLVVRKVGWYRDRKTGQRKHWNGQSWTDISVAITPFVYEARPTVVSHPPEPAVQPSPPPDVSPRRPAALRTMVIVVSAILAVSVAIVVAATLSSGNTVRLQRSAGPSLRAASGTTAPPVVTTPTSIVPSTVITTTSTATSTTDVGVLGSPSTTVAGSVPNVTIVGDSISALAKDAIQRDLHRYNLYIDAVGGTTMVQHLANIQNIASDGLPRDWVIELGTNDTFQKNPNWASDFANEVSALQAQHCVDFVTVNPSLSPISVGLDTSIANAVATHPNFHSIDWGSAEFRKPGWVGSDRIHPTTSGDVQLAKMIRKAIGDC